jgi:DNA repair exonuclease SbcCD ATPase subunit
MTGETKQITKKAPAKTGVSSTDALVDEVYALFRDFVRDYANGDNFDSLRARLKEVTTLREEVDTLRKENTRLQTAFDETVDRFSRREAKQTGEITQHQLALESCQKKVDDADMASKRLKEALAKGTADLADKGKQVDEQEIRIQSMIDQSKKQEAEIHKLKIAEGERDDLRAQLSAMTDQKKATAKELAQTLRDLNFVNAHSMQLRPIRNDRDGV